MPEKHIRLTRVKSSNVHSIGYDESEGVLEVQFRSGGVYHYYDVPLSVFVGLREAPSKGRYLHKVIKGKGFRYRKIAQRPVAAPARGPSAKATQ